MQGPEVAFVDNVVSARNILMHALKTLRAVLNDLFHVEKRMTDAIADSCSLKGILCGEASNSELMLSCPSWKICNVGYVENDSRVHLAGQMCKTLARVFLPLLQSEIDRICEEEMEKQKCSREHVMSYPLAWFIKRADKTVPSPEVTSALGTLLVVTVGKGSSHHANSFLNAPLVICAGAGAWPPGLVGLLVKAGLPHHSPAMRGRQAVTCCGKSAEDHLQRLGQRYVSRLSDCASYLVHLP